MHLLAGPYAAFAVLLTVAGVAKSLRPLPTVRALRSVSLPASAALVRLLGAGEAVLGLAALFVAGPLPAALVALSYASFAVFVRVAQVRGGTVSSCGCFGKPDTPPTGLHIVVNAAAALTAAAAAAWPAHAPLRELTHSPASGVPYILLSLVTLALAYLALAEWPRLVAVRRTVAVLREREAHA